MAYAYFLKMDIVTDNWQTTRILEELTPISILDPQKRNNSYKELEI